MRLRAVLLTIVLALGVLTSWAVAQSARACSCVAATPAEHYARAEAVFTGRLVSREAEHPSGGVHSSTDPARYVFAVESVYKGDVHGRETVVSPDSGASCGLELSGEGPFLVFAVPSSSGTGAEYAAGLCQGTRPLTDALRTELAAVSGAAPAPPLPGARSSAPPPSGAAGWQPAGLQGRTMPGLTLIAALLVLGGWGGYRLARRRRGGAS